MKFLIKNLIFISSWHTTDNRGKEYLHHRDNPCRKFGVGPDWEDNFNYKIARVGIYLQNYEETKFHLNLIPYSHKKKYSIREFLDSFIKNTLSQ